MSRRRVIPLPKTKANPITHPQALFQKDQVSGKPPLTRLRTGEPLPPSPAPPPKQKKINVQVRFCPIIMCKRNRVCKCRVFMSASQHFFFLSLSFFFGGGGLVFESYTYLQMSSKGEICTIYMGCFSCRL